MPVKMKMELKGGEQGMVSELLSVSFGGFFCEMDDLIVLQTVVLWILWECHVVNGVGAHFLG